MKARIDGYKACEDYLLHGREVLNPHVEGSEVWVWWNKGWGECYYGE